MRGHDKLIAMRSMGLRPVTVFINDYRTPAKYLDGTILDVTGDDMNTVDMRFLVGLTVSIASTTEERAKAILEACKRGGAAKVGVVHLPVTRADQRTTDYIEIWNGTHTA